MMTARSAQEQREYALDMLLSGNYTDRETLEFLLVNELANSLDPRIRHLTWANHKLETQRK